MDLLSFLLYFLFTQDGILCSSFTVAAWEQMDNAVTGTSSTSRSLSTSIPSTSISPTPIVTITTSSRKIGSSSNVTSLTRSSRSTDNGSSEGGTSLLMLTPSIPPTPHFVNDSFIVFCKTLSTATIAPPTSSDTTASVAPTAVKPVQNKEVETKWIDPNGKVRENTKGRVHIEKKAGSLALVFEHISLDDRGNWTCEANAKDVKEKKTFELSVYQKISFDKVEMVQSARDGRDATVYCRVKAEPAPTISWLFNGEFIPVINGTHSSGKYVTFTHGLVIKDVTQADAGEYTCRAMRITPTFADTDQITILLRIQHKPHWFDNNTSLLQYAYIGGSVNISCDAMGEPPPSFTWLHNGHGIAGKNYRHFYADYGSTLQIHVQNESHFGDYKCKVANPLGTLERIIKLSKGQKPAGPSRFQLKRAFTDGFEVDIRSVKFSSVEENMQTFGYRVEFMSEKDLKYSAGNWSYAKRKEFLFHRDGRRFVISGLKSNTTYLMRAASRNLAGLSDWSSVKIFATLENFACHSAALVTRHAIVILALGFIVNSALRHF